jgi:hypothetical protein
MNRYTRLWLPLAVLSLIVLTGCSKTTVRTVGGGGGNNGGGGSGGNGCPTALKITAGDTIPVVGADVSIKTSIPGLLYQWAGPGNFFLAANGDQDSITIHGIRIYQSGWYYCSGSQPNCNNSIFDSVYIDVQYQQGSPSCSLANDQMSNTAGLPDFNGGLITKSYSPSYSAIVLDMSDAATEYDFIFNPNNGNTEPKDGVYYTTSYDFLDPNIDADAISLIINYFPYFLNSDAGQKVYVSHVNGKLRISFCSLMAEGSGASGTFTGQVTEQ